jgi:subtilisin-like proprotein convertase family protein
MAETDLTQIPSVFISQNDGQALSSFLTNQSMVAAQLTLNSASYAFNVQETLSCEFIGVRVQTDHTARGDLRIVLTSPTGTRSILQRMNQDTLAGPTDWTYYSVQHFYESSFGTWTLAITDEDIKGTGSVKGVSLILTGVPIADTDHDGLDDGWEMQHFQTLAYGPADDPDMDGFTNAREQIMGTDPSVPNSPFWVDLSLWDTRLLRISWPSTTKMSYRVQVGPQSIAPLSWATAKLPGQFPETEAFIPYANGLHQFFRVEAVGKQD